MSPLAEPVPTIFLAVAWSYFKPSVSAIVRMIAAWAICGLSTNPWNNPMKIASGKSSATRLRNFPNIEGVLLTLL